MTMWIQFLVTIFVLAVAIRLGANLRQHRGSYKANLLCLLLWIAVLVVFWSPEVASRLAVTFGIGRGADLLIYCSIVLLFYLVFRIFERLERIEHSITTLTRELALRNEHDSKDDTNSHRQL